VARSLILEHAGLTKIRPAVGYACLQERTRAHLQTPHELTLRCAGSSLAQSSGEGSVDEHSHHIPPGGCRRGCRSAPAIEALTVVDEDGTRAAPRSDPLRDRGAEGNSAAAARHQHT